MATKGNDPLREELRSSQVYHVLKGSNIPVAGKIAQGLDRAAQGLDQVVEGFSTGTRPSGGNRAGHPYQAPPPAWQAPSQTPPQQRTAPQNTGYRPPQTGPSNVGGKTGSGYYYSYAQGGQPQQGQRAQQTSRPQQPQQAPRAGQTGRAVPPQGRQTRPPQAPVYQPPRGNAGKQTVPNQPQVPMKMVRAGSPAKFYITGAVALFYAMVAPMYEPQHFLIFLVVLVLVFLGSSALFKGKKMFVPVEPEKPKEEPKPQPEKVEKSQTGNPEVDKIIDEGREYLKKLRAADDAIPDEALSEDITRMERASADIFRYIADHPEKAPQIRKFMNYYLPTTLKLLNSYQRLSSQSVKGENITSTMFNIAGMMHTVADAFEKQLDSLFSEEAMDISADITVFETLLKQEGFVEEEKKESGK